MTSGLYHAEPEFKDVLDYCADKLKPHVGLDIRDVLYPREEKSPEAEQELKKTSIVQPVLFSIEYALAKLWISRGINPAALIGHSIGEYVAACLSGVLSLDEALWLVARRGSIIQNLSPGSMLSIPLSEKEVSAYIGDGLAIAAINGDDLCVVSGEKEGIRLLADKLSENNIASRLLQTSHAFHSPMMEPACGTYIEEVKKVALKEPQIPYISNVTGAWMSMESATDPAYWADHVRKPVDFYHGVAKLIEGSYHVFLEVGPGNTLCSLLNRITIKGSRPGSFYTIPSLAHPLDKTPDMESLARAMGRLWISGAAIDWKKYYRDQNRRRVSLPGYAFSRKRFWIESSADGQSACNNDGLNDHEKFDEMIRSAQRAHNTPHHEIEMRLFEIWSEILGIKDLNITDSFFDLGGNSLMATQLIAQINERLGQDLTLTDFFFDPTISGLSRLVKVRPIENAEYRGNDTPRLPILFPIQPKGTNLPMYIVAGAHENRYFDPVKMKSSYEEDFLRYLSNLVPHLGMDQPVYGFRPKGLLATEKPHKSVEEMAEAYIKEILEFQPEGPYFIAGECVGGIVAYEMARQLKAANKQVAHLIMMDTHCPSLYFAMKERYIYARHRIGMLFRDSINDFRRDGLRLVVQSLINKSRSIPILFFPVTRNLRIQRQIMMRGYEYQKTLLQYRPVPFQVDATLILNEEWFRREPDFGWGRTLKKTIDFIKVPGDHLTRLTTYGKVTGQHIRDIIKKSQEKYCIIGTGNPQQRQSQ